MSKKIEAGQVLISQAFWNDPIYNRCVVYILDKDEFGATGIILNKPSAIPVQEVFPDFNLRGHLNYGGAFHANLVGFLHDYKDVPESVGVGTGVFWCGDIETVRHKIDIKEMVPERLKFFAGFVEWSYGELEQEVEENKWWVDDMDPEELFSCDPEVLWQYLLIRSGNSYGILYEVADPVLN